MWGNTNIAFSLRIPFLAVKPASQTCPAVNTLEEHSNETWGQALRKK
jgi:hypothetical protein